MASKRTLVDQDPDYESIPIHIQQKKLRILEQDVKEATIRKIEKIIRTQFACEIVNKEQEIDQITQQLSQARSLMDRLRANIVMKYYATGGQATDEPPSEVHPTSTVHPNVKKYLGKSPASHKLPHSSPNKAQAVTSLSSSSQDTASISLNNDTKISMEYGNLSPEKSSDTISRTARLKKKCRIVVGNVSKYIPAGRREDNDQATHKWMVYVRGSKERPKIDDIVKKVIFFLHPSYRPNDLVEIGHPPFHLTRRGWGEFPIRVQLHFHDQRNKPVDIIHNLKLDKTLTGLQTLGAETLVDIWLFKPEDKLRNPLNIDTEETSSLAGLSSALLLSMNNDKDGTEVLFPEAAEGSSAPCTSLKQRLESIPYFDTPNLLAINNSTLGETLIFEPPANDIEKEEVVLTDAGDDILNAKLSRSSSNGKSTTELPDVVNPISVTSGTASTLSTEPVLQDSIKSSIPELSTAIFSSRSSTDVSSKAINAETITKIQTVKSSILQSSTESPKLAFSSQMPITSIISSISKSRHSTNSTGSAAVNGNNVQNSESDVVQSSTNGLRTFVKCIDSKGQIILVPCDSLLKSQSSNTSVTNPTTSGQISMTNPSKLVATTKHSLIKQSAKPTAVTSLAVNGAQLPSSTNPNKLISTSPSYLVRMLPSRHGGPGQLIFIPNMSTSTTTQSSNGNLSQTKQQASDASIKGSVTSQPNCQIVMNKDQKPIARILEDSLYPGTKIWRKDAFGELERAIGSIRLEHYDTFDMLLRRVVKLHPLVANSPDRSCHPYCAPSTQTFHAWNIGKQKACEWTRAVAIKESLLHIIHNYGDKSKWREKDVWSVKRIMMWCKRHGFTPLRIDCTNPTPSTSSSIQGIPNFTTKTEAKDLIEGLEKQHSEIESEKQSQEPEEQEIDIITVDDEKPLLRRIKSESPCKSNKESTIYLPFFSRAAQFIKEKAQEVGVNIKPVEILPSVSAPVIEEMILAACKEFAQDIIRNGLNEAFERLGGKRCPDTIEETDVIKGILKLPFSDMLTNESLGVPLTQEIIRAHLQPL